MVRDPEIERIGAPPHASSTIYEGSLKEHGYTIKSIILRQYILGEDHTLGPYSLISALVRTDEGEAELVYDRGYRGGCALEDAAKFLRESLGVSGLILRCTMALRAE